MGRLRKAKADQIAKLRGEGYTQAETAEKVDVCLKTVRKYDPTSIAGSAKEWKELQTLPERVRSLEQAVQSLSALAFSYQVEKVGKDEKYWAWCPKCDCPVELEELEDKKTRKPYYGCHECGTPIPDAKEFWEPIAYFFGGEIESNTTQAGK